MLTYIGIILLGKISTKIFISSLDFCSRNELDFIKI